MLTHLHIRNFTLMEDRELVLREGLTALTGETGAGKSILLDALALALGDRADADKVRPGCQRAEVSATFDVRRQPAVLEWLREQTLGEDECVVRRVIAVEGRSRAYVNGSAVTLAQLRTLGNLLVDIHSQHEHQSLLRTATHRLLLDGFADHAELVVRVAEAYATWYQLQSRRQAVQADSEALNARYQLLSYQVDELDQLGLEEGELQRLEERQQVLANFEQLRCGCEQVRELCEGDEQSIERQLNHALGVLQALPATTRALDEATSLLRSALIHVEEAGRELQGAAGDGDENLAELPEIEARLSAIYELARKHRIDPAELLNFHQEIADELHQLRSGDQQLDWLDQQLEQALVDYQHVAKQLSEARTRAATALAKRVNQQLKKLAMGQARFEANLTPLGAPTRHGGEQVEFLISTVPGQKPKALMRIASGGELSRVSLAIALVTAKTSVPPTMVFDEVDVGIGGTTGDAVGSMLRELGETTQVLCVTHLAQVASKAHHHLRVEKRLNRRGASTEISELAGERKVQEIARMMGGLAGSAQSLAHAREMIGGA